MSAWAHASQRINFFLKLWPFFWSHSQLYFPPLVRPVKSCLFKHWYSYCGVINTDASHDCSVYEHITYHNYCCNKNIKLAKRAKWTSRHTHTHTFVLLLHWLLRTTCTQSQQSLNEWLCSPSCPESQIMLVVWEENKAWDPRWRQRRKLLQKPK